MTPLTIISPTITNPITSYSGNQLWHPHKLFGEKKMINDRIWEKARVEPCLTLVPGSLREVEMNGLVQFTVKVRAGSTGSAAVRCFCQPTCWKSLSEPSDKVGGQFWLQRHHPRERNLSLKTGPSFLLLEKGQILMDPTYHCFWHQSKKNFKARQPKSPKDRPVVTNTPISHSQNSRIVKSTLSRFEAWQISPTLVWTEAD